ncbi:helix-turn-helix domain-containing protein [Nocardia sp. NBC_00403]|uniref:helix-turn-helix domain-containing protein n=1 Tax=Nocardia sp. NBC_00403 TaxID=2975990 RepID=UPI002E1B968A
MGAFQAVVTTGIYCLPPCPGRPLPSNVVPFPSQAGAEAAGFRACHRCRPYRAAAEPAQTSELVCRAIDLIAEGALDVGSEAALAAQLAVSQRHLRRMFHEQVGATPDQLARSRRAHFARRLLDDTDLSATDIAFAAGFGSLRQFNRVMTATFRAAPLELRRRRRRADRLVADGGLALRVPLPAPVDLGRRLSQLACHTIRGVEKATKTVYRRTVRVDGDPGVIEISAAGPADALLIAHLPRIEGLIHQVDQVRRFLDGRAWDPFEAGVRAIVADHVGAAAAPAVLGEIVTEYGAPVAGLGQFGLGRLFPTPADLREFGGVDVECARAIRDHSRHFGPERTAAACHGVR